MGFAFEAMLLLAILHFAGGKSLREVPGLNFDKFKIEEVLKSSNNTKRSPLEVGLVSFEPDQRHGRHFNIPALARPNAIPKTMPIVSKSRTISTTSTISHEKGPKGGHILVPLGNNHHVIIPVLQKSHPIDPKIIVDHKELLVDHAAEIILDQKHVILEHSPPKTVILEHKPLLLTQSAHHGVLLNGQSSHTVIFEHKPVLVDRGEHEPNILIHSAPKTLVLEHKPIVVTHPVHRNVVVHPKTVVVGASRTILISHKSQIHEIIVHRHVPKEVVVHQTVDDESNVYRSHFGGFGVGLDYGGHGAGHGFHVPVI